MYSILRSNKLYQLIFIAKRGGDKEILVLKKIFLSKVEQKLKVNSIVKNKEFEVMIKEKVKQYMNLIQKKTEQLHISSKNEQLTLYKAVKIKESKVENIIRVENIFDALIQFS